MDSEKKKYSDLRIRSVNQQVRDEIKNIAQNEGQTISSFLKPHLRKIAESYPPQMRLKNKGFEN